jgi:hypothetical protein
MHVWLNRLLENYPRELSGVAVDRAGYVRRQVYDWLLQKRFGGLGWTDLARRFGLLSAKDWSLLASTVVDRESWRRLGGVVSSGAGAAETQWQGLQPLTDIADITEFSEWLSLNPTD